MTVPLRLVTRQAAPPELRLTIDEWIIYIEADDFTDRTIQNYRWYTDRLADWLLGHGCARLEQVSQKTLRAWAVDIKQSLGWSASTRKVAVSVTRQFFGWCWEQQLIDTNPALNLKIPKVKECPQRTITRPELDRLLTVCNPDTVIGRRDAAIMSLLFDSGLRSIELCRLRLDDLNLDEKELHVRIKGGAVLPGWWGERTAGYLTAWLAVRVARPGVETVFVSIRGRTAGNSITDGGLRAALRAVGQRAKIPGVSPHAFRRGFAVAMSAAGVPDNILKDLGRWSDTSMIRRYTLAQRVRHLYRSPVDFGRK